LQDTLRHKGLRNRLVDMLQSKGISHEVVLNAMRLIPRHLFISPEFEHFAYEDKPFAIGEEQTISQPYTVAFQTQLIDPQKGEKVLEIGTGSGYQAAVLAACGLSVYSVERIPTLHLLSKERFHKYKLPIQTKCGDGTQGWAEHSPFDKILVTAGAPKVPIDLFKQLKVGGKLVIPVGNSTTSQKMVCLTKTSSKEFTNQVFDNFSFVPLIGVNGWDE
jgi:protein-L-isoaspartate(D-aspartate) O-methyltransferase